MSQETRRSIAYWFMLFLGIALTSLQFDKYYKNTLNLTIEEGIVTSVSVVLMVNPLFILDSLKKFINSKYGNNDK